MSRVLSGAALCIAVAVAGVSCARDGGPKVKDIGPIELTVTQGGVTRSATLKCASPAKATGYLVDGEPDGTTAACVTALMSDPVLDYLEHGKRPTGKTCKPKGDEPNGATFTATGPWINGRPISRTLTVGDRCTAALWSYLLPLRVPQADPLLLKWRDLERQ